MYFIATMSMENDPFISWTTRKLRDFPKLGKREERIQALKELMDGFVANKNRVVGRTTLYADALTKLMEFLVQGKIEPQCFLPHYYALFGITPTSLKMTCFVCGEEDAHCLPCGHYAHMFCLKTKQCPYFFCRKTFDKSFFLEHARKLQTQHDNDQE